jgi:hypothetical protein
MLTGPCQYKVTLNCHLGVGNMDFDDCLRRYRQGRFTDEDVTRCTGLSVRGWRELIKFKAVRTEEEEYGRGPGRVRTCDAHTLKRAAVISALHQCGLSLAVAGQIAFFLPYHTLLYEVCDPITILLQHSTEIDPKTGPRARVERPMVDWFDPLKPAKVEAELDWLIEIFDGRFVGARYNTGKDAVTIFGDLRERATRFVAWLPFPRRDQFSGGAIERIAQEVRGDGLIRFIADWENPSRWPKKLIKELHRFGYQFEHHEGKTDPLCMAAEAAVRSPVFKTTINPTLAIRKALRRYLGIEPALPNPAIRESP